MTTVNFGTFVTIGKPSGVPFLAWISFWKYNIHFRWITEIPEQLPVPGIPVRICSPDGKEACSRLNGHIVEFDEQSPRYSDKLKALHEKYGIPYHMYDFYLGLNDFDQGKNYVYTKKYKKIVIQAFFLYGINVYYLLYTRYI